jgi:hypothetical protein
LTYLAFAKIFFKRSNMKSFYSRLIPATIVLLVVCSSWGFLMHRTATQLSVYQLPDAMLPFFHQNMALLVRHSVRPDERRNSDKSEAPKHFIDLEAYGPDAAQTMPQEWEEAVALYSKDTLVKYGYVPYWILVMKDRLTSAFRKGDKDSILFYAADLAHYIQDAHVPLHTTLNYDGQLTNQKGLHSLWESTVPELTILEFKLNGKKKAKYLKDPKKTIWKVIRHSFELVPGVLATEQEISTDFKDSVKYRIQVRNGRESRSYSTAFARAYGKEVQKSVNAQAISAANLLADFWYTAWVDAGKPPLNESMTKKWEAADAEKVTGEVEAYRKNSLLKNGWLLSKKETAGAATEE